jgi:hypothetical protein
MLMYCSTHCTPTIDGNVPVPGSVNPTVVASGSTLPWRCASCNTGSIIKHFLRLLSLTLPAQTEGVNLITLSSIL